MLGTKKIEQFRREVLFAMHRTEKVERVRTELILLIHRTMNDSKISDTQKVEAIKDFYKKAEMKYRQLGMENEK